MEKDNKPIMSSIGLWNEFSKTADFKSSEYDKELLNRIKKALGLDLRCNISMELISTHISLEQLLAAILKAMEPFSIMLDDLLNMFETAGAQFSDNNIQMHFDFKDAEENFGLDLNHFRIQKKMVAEVVCHELQFAACDPWKDFVDPLKEMFYRIYQYENIPHVPDNIETWLREYDDRERNWPDSFPLPPQTGIDRIDTIIADVWRIPKAACKLFHECYRPDLGRYGSLREKNRQMHSAFYQAESDRLVGKMIELLCYLSYAINSTTREQDNSAPIIDEICHKLEEYRDSLPIVGVKKERLLEKLLDILNLPVWEKRHALYSAWVSTQIVFAFDKTAVKYIVEDGVLSFSFGGSKIAIIRHDSIDYTLFAELRTPFADVKGHGRKHSIQPDYSLCVNDENDPKNTVLVVECKQYKRASKKNFTEAIVDYAGGRPIAQIMLVNYTSVPDSIRKGLPAELSERVPFFDALIPGDESCELFKVAVRESLPNHNRVSLSWGKTPLDLDLMLIITEPNGEITKINFSNMGMMDRFPFAHLTNDDRDGNGYEEIHVLTYHSMRYDFYVHNFSGEKTNGKIRLEAVFYNDSGIWVNSNANLDKTCLWHLLEIDNSSVRIINKIEPDRYTEKTE